LQNSELYLDFINNTYEGTKTSSQENRRIVDCGHNIISCLNSFD